jgi:hypothetical protein
MPLQPQNYFFQTGVIPAYDSFEAENLPITVAPNQQWQKGQVIGEITGVNCVQSVIATGATSGFFVLNYGGFASANIPYNSTAAAVQGILNAMPPFAGSSVQSLAQTGATGGTFVLSLAMQQTVALPYNATAAQVQTALGNLPNIGGANVSCTGGPMGTAAVVVSFQGILANTPLPPIGFQLVPPLGPH